MNTLTQKSIQNKARELGFCAVGFSPSAELTSERQPLQNWLQMGYHASMGYMENHLEMRLNPQLLVDGAKSVITLLHNYYTPQLQPNSAPIVSRYAYGSDYHEVIKEKMEILFSFIKEYHCPQLEGRMFVDSAPVLEKAWAVKAGLGWIGRNSLLLTRKMGSYVFISQLITNLPVDEFAQQESNRCGNCTRCVDACPTGALLGNGTVDGGKCISYLTIELKSDIPPEFKGKMEGRVFGCDICQEVCPWNQRLTPHTEPQFNIRGVLLEPDIEKWRNMTQEQFSETFKKSPVKRAKFSGLIRNINFVFPAKEQ